MVRQTRLSVDMLVAPLFIVEGSAIRKPISSLIGQFHLSADEAALEAAQLYDGGVPAVILFGIPASKDPCGSSGLAPDGVVQRAVAAIKHKVPDMVVITDVCLCEYTSHGHCGIIDNQCVDNDATLPLLAQMALSHARAGADVIAPSDMMDGRIGALRSALDSEGFSQLPILSYAVKYASAYYGPFREAAGSTPQFGDRRSYQMDYANAREALHEAQLDIQEGADMLMVKPALAYLDIIQQVRQITTLPIAAYNVSGEYAMIQNAAAAGLIDGDAVMLETLTAIHRAGADIILTYFAKRAASLLKG
jgi:porphobilinogen synthase